MDRVISSSHLKGTEWFVLGESWEEHTALLLLHWEQFSLPVTRSTSCSRPGLTNPSVLPVPSTPASPPAPAALLVLTGAVSVSPSSVPMLAKCFYAAVSADEHTAVPSPVTADKVLNCACNTRQ